MPDRVIIVEGQSVKQKSSQSSKSHKSLKTADGRGVKPRKPAQGRQPSTALAKQEPTAPPTVVDPPAPEPQDTPQEDPKRQWWYRPPDSKARKIVEKIVVMDAAGHDDKEIAKRLKTTPGAVAQYRYLAKNIGWRAEETGEAIDLEAELALNIDRKIVRNISASLDGQMTNYQTHEMTIKAAQGRGIFKNHTESKQEIEANMQKAVMIQVIMPPLGEDQQRVAIPDHMVGGEPAYVEGEVTDGGDSTNAS
jgi:hypothetical protein